MYLKFAARADDSFLVCPWALPIFNSSSVPFGHFERCGIIILEGEALESSLLIISDSS